MFYQFLYPLHTVFSGLNVFRYITFRCAGAILTAFLIVLFAGPAFIRLMQRYQIGQVVREDGMTTHFGKRGVPTMGGILILAAITFAQLLWVDFSNRFVWVLLGLTLWFGVVGAYDDFQKIKKKNSRGLSARGKLLCQVMGAMGAGLILYKSTGFNSELSIPFLKNISPDLGWFYIVFAVLVVVGSSNAVNLTDGLDGLVTGPVVISSSVYLIFSYLTGHAVLANYLQIPYISGAGEVAVFCGAIMGAGLGFLWFNAFPAQVFMGDVGSLALGGALGLIAIIIKQEILLAIVGGIFVMEALSVILQVGYYKMTGGRRIFLMAPFHHHFEKKGWHETKVVVRFWIVSIALGLAALATLKLR